MENTAPMIALRIIVLTTSGSIYNLPRARDRYSATAERIPKVTHYVKML